jgi:superfamily II DNA or RNA helicase
MFEKCQRWWYYKYIKKIPTVEDLAYAHGGTVVHSCLEEWYSDRIKDETLLRMYFNTKWQGFKLEGSKIAGDKETYWDMVLNGIKQAFIFDELEHTISYPEVKGILDCVNFDKGFILDWKTSKRSVWNEEEYLKQLLFYCWLYHRSFKRIPREAKVFYLRNEKDKYLTINPDKEDLDNVEHWFTNIHTEMERISATKKMPKRCAVCQRFCPYVQICEEEQYVDMEFIINIVGSNLYIEGPINEMLNKHMVNKFSYELKNAHWIKQHNNHANTTVKFYVNRRLPIGFLEGVQKTLKDYGEHFKKKTKITIKDHREFDKTEVLMPEKFINGRELRDYQLQAVEDFLKKKIAIWQIGTGAGKTTAAVEVIRRLQMKTLFIVDRIELLNQTKNVIEETLGIEVGMIGHNKIDIKDVTVATIQTLLKYLDKFKPYLAEVRFVICDETHKVASSSYRTIGRYLTNTEYRLGMSGTADGRSDGNDMMITSVVGYICHDLSAEKLIKDGWLMKPQVVFVEGFNDPTMKKYDMLINQSEDYADIYSFYIAENENRNLLIRDIADKYKDKKILILTKLISHGINLNNMIPGSKHLHGTTNKEERKKMFNDFVDGKFNILISTVSIFSEGIDIPSLDMIINASGNAGKIKTVQMLGRILRLCKNKEGAYYYDFIDDLSRFTQSASYKRMRTLRREGHSVIIKTREEVLG